MEKNHQGYILLRSFNFYFFLSLGEGFLTHDMKLEGK